MRTSWRAVVVSTIASAGVAHGQNAAMPLRAHISLSAVEPITRSAVAPRLLAAGSGSTCLGEADVVWCWGNVNDVVHPATADGVQRVPDVGVGVTALAVGFSHACAVVAEAARCWGRNDFGQLGAPGPASARAIPIRAWSGSATAIADGRDDTCIVRLGAVFCVGGQYGDSPVAIDGVAHRVTMLGRSQRIACAIADGAVWCFGSGRFNQEWRKSHGDTSRSAVPIIGIPAPATALAVGDDHACAVADGTVWCWGENFAGQLGPAGGYYSAAAVRVSGLPARATAIAAGSTHSCAVADGQVWCWGGNSAGQLGSWHGHEHDGMLPHDSTPRLVSLADPAVMIAAGGEHTCATSAGTTRCWGGDEFGELGASGLETCERTPDRLTGDRAPFACSARPLRVRVGR